MNEFKGRKIAILGLGAEGNSLIEYLSDSGAELFVFDEKAPQDLESSFVTTAQEKGIPITSQPFESVDLKGFDIVFRSPGVRLTVPPIQEALKAGVRVSSATKLFFEKCPAPIVGVTGTKGKGTTSTLIYEMLKKGGKNAFLGGNIGTPPLGFLKDITPESVVVLELSSFQLQDLEVSPHIAVLLMITSEHMDWHESVEEYVDAKRNLLRFQNTDDFAIVNHDYPASNESDIYTDAKVYKVSREQKVEQGCYVLNDEIFLKMRDKEEKILDVKDVALPGSHNLENVCAAILAASMAGVDIKSIIPVVKEFTGLPYRLELISTVKGVKYYNDSFSTTPETAIAAIESFDNPEILILGGSSKNSDFSELAETIHASENIKAIIGIGEEWERIKEAIGKIPGHIIIMENIHTMKEAVKRAQALAELGDIVILSPACASFGMFKNYKDRGNQFNDEVRSL